MALDELLRLKRERFLFGQIFYLTKLQNNNNWRSLKYSQNVNSRLTNFKCLCLFGKI